MTRDELVRGLEQIKVARAVVAGGIAQRTGKELEYPLLVTLQDNIDTIIAQGVKAIAALELQDQQLALVTIQDRIVALTVALL